MCFLDRKYIIKAMLINKIIFMGTPEYALPSLTLIHENYKKELIAVFTKPDAKQGRNLKVQITSIKEYALKNNLPVFTPKDKTELTEKIKELKPDLIVIIAYGILIPKEITEKYLCVNLHGSLLPKYRGASPIQTSLLNNDQKTGITLIKINEKLDAGPIIMKEEIAISLKDNFGSLSQKLSVLSAKIIIEYLKDLKSKQTTTPHLQDEALASFCQKIKSSDLDLSLVKTKKEFLGKIMAFAPKPGAFIMDKGKRYKILAAQIINGKIEIIKIQPEGKQPMLYQDFLLGHKKGIILPDFLE
jgi:methionyl-tRNA formyltransferase